MFIRYINLVCLSTSNIASVLCIHVLLTFWQWPSVC